MSTLTPTEMIEAAASAIRDECANRSGYGMPWHKLKESVKDDYRRAARSMLIAVGAIEGEAPPLGPGPAGDIPAG